MSVISNIMDACVTQISGVAGMTAGRTFQGKKRFLDSETFETNIAALTAENQGYAICFPGVRTGKGQIEVGEFSVEVLIFAKLDKNTSTTADTLWNFIESIAVALQQEMAFYSLGARPVACRYSQDDDSDIEENFATFLMEVTFEAGLIAGAM